jgi:hypothetical protein
MTDRLPDLLPAETLLTPEDARRGVTRYVTALTDRITAEVERVRAERRDLLGPDTPLGRSDVAPLVRNLAGLADVLDYAAQSLRQAARHAREHVGDEVRETGEGKVVVPDGLGREVVAKVTAPRSRVVDTPAFLDALAAVRRTEHGRAQEAHGLPPGDEVADTVQQAFTHGYRLALDDLTALATVKPKVSGVDALSRTLMAAGQDDLAGLLDRAMRWETGDEKVTVTVEDPKRTRRG